MRDPSFGKWIFQILNVKINRKMKKLWIIINAGLLHSEKLKEISKQESKR